MDSDTRTLVKALCEEMAELKTLLKAINTAISPKGAAGGEDLVYQHPDSAGNLHLAAGGLYVRDMSVARRLVYLSVDVPEGVVISIYRDNTLWMFASNEIGAMEFKQGVYFGNIRIEVQNTTETDQTWSVRFIFS